MHSRPQKNGAGNKDDFAKYMRPVALKLLGEPNKQLSKKNELRYGTHGSMQLHLLEGWWRDHENKATGNVLDLVKREKKCGKAGAVKWMQHNVGLPKCEKRPGKVISATYDYADEDGNFSFQVVRFDNPKTFSQRRPNPDKPGDWIWNMTGVVRVPYRLPELLTAVAAGQTIFIAEGEKDVDNLRALGLAATTNPGGAGKWTKALSKHLRGADVVILPDNDEAGRKHAVEVRNAIEGVAARVREVELPGLSEKGDVSDWLVAGGTREELMRLADEASPATRPNGNANSADADDGGRKSTATVLVDIAEGMYELGVSVEGETFAVPKHGPKVVAMLRGGKSSLRGDLARLYREKTGKVAGQQALADAGLVIEGIAQNAEPQALHIRVAKHGDDIWLDLGDATGRAVRINASGWRIESQAPVLFKRTVMTAALPEPKRDGDISALWQFLNVAEADRPLVIAWLVSCFFADIPHPILALSGEQGTGKSTAEKTLVSLIDPSPVPLRKPPRDIESWVTAAAGSWVIGVDNLSAIQDWFSDSLCRAVTGDGDVRRKLYTDGGLHVFSFRRCIILNGIDLNTVRGDLADRLLPVELERIPDDRRIDENDLGPSLQAVFPRLLGALLGDVVDVARALPSVRLGKKPRMADFARVLAAVDAIKGTDGLAAYADRQSRTATESLTGDEFVMALAKSKPTGFKGTADALRRAVERPEKALRDWPATARAVTALLKRQAPVMRKAGWSIEKETGHGGYLVWTITPPQRRDAGFSTSPTSPTSPDPSRSHDGPGRDDGDLGDVGDVKNGPSQGDKADFEERAGFLEYDAGLDRSEAERRARTRG